MNKLLDFIKKTLAYVTNLYQSLTSSYKQIIPVALNIVEGIKNFTDSPTEDVILEIVKAAIPGTADDVFIDKANLVVKQWVSFVLAELQIANNNLPKGSVKLTLNNDNDKLKASLKKLNACSPETKKIIYHGLAALLIEKLSDSKVAWGDSTLLAQYSYTNLNKNANQKFVQS